MHRHKWKIVDKYEQTSTVEELHKAGQYISGKGLWPDQLERLATRRFIVTYICEECKSEKVERI